MKYELFYLVGEKNENQLDAIKEDVNAMLTAEGATLDEQEIMEKRKFSYEIKHQSRGTYVTRRFDLPEIDFWADEANGEKEFGIKAITNKLNLHTQILRSMIVKTSELPELGAKEIRKARELKEGKNEKPNLKNQRPARTERTAPVRKTSEKTEPATIASKPAEAKKVKKEDSTIDKQLEEILNI